VAKYVCMNCGVLVGLWAKGDGTYWKHQNGGWKAKATCGMPAVPIRAAEASMSPALRAALADVRRGIRDGLSLDCAIADVMQRRGFMRHELKTAYALAEAD
jgi:hypothetical protein